MKKTTIQVKGFDCEFQVQIESREYLSIIEAEKYVQKSIVDTAYVVSVKHENDAKKR
jgi:hypothetical protein